ncbi:hypothetical protein EYC84_004786 [Monilinia fructicola]|uniref:Uncharacterized protein n=1 Tax=Monilinia fructicola TaxID=38448 RepID=A0A5M9K5C6_MONFR|nr:hypothetical protein EYC84_004786 [Monilinia fructicola]
MYIPYCTPYRAEYRLNYGPSLPYLILPTWQRREKKKTHPHHERARQGKASQVKASQASKGCRANASFHYAVLSLSLSPSPLSFLFFPFLFSLFHFPFIPSPPSPNSKISISSFPSFLFIDLTFICYSSSSSSSPSSSSASCPSSSCPSSIKYLPRLPNTISYFHLHLKHQSNSIYHLSNNLNQSIDKIVSSSRAL